MKKGFRRRRILTRTKQVMDSSPRILFYVLNLDKHTGPGTHWVLLSTLNPSLCYYMDPVGEQKAPVEIEKRMKEYQKYIMRKK